jgi:hypothetical protein
MKRIAAAALSLALIAGTSAGAMAQNSGSSTPANTKQMTGKKETAAQAHWRHHNDPAGDRYTDALNTLGADGYSGINNIAENGSNFTATATSPQQQQMSVTVDPATNSVTPNTQ